MADKLMYIFNNYPSVDFDQWLKRLETQTDESNNQNSIKDPKVVKPTNKNLLL